MKRSGGSAGRLRRLAGECGHSLAPIHGGECPTRLARRALLQGAVAFLLLGSAALALDPAKALTQYDHRVWTVRDGLPHNFVSDIVQTRDGYLWFGTLQGLGRFDGRSVRVFDEHSTPLLEGGWVSRLLESRDGTLWMTVNQRRSLTYLRGGRFGRYPEEPEELPAQPTALYEDRDGTLWIGTGAGLCKVQPAGRICYSEADGWQGDLILSLRSGADGSLWIGTDRGLSRWDGRRFHSENGTGLPETAVFALVEDGNRTLWLGTTNGLFRLDGGVVEGPVAGLTAQLFSLLRDSAGCLWAGSYRDGLFRWCGDGPVRHYGTSEGLSDVDVRALFEDREGSVWIGTRGGGLEQLVDTRVTPYGPPEGLVGEHTRAVLETRDGSIWTATLSGLNRIRPDGRVQTYTDEDGLSGRRLGHLAEDRAGRLWIGTIDHGLDLLADGRFRKYGEDDGLSSEAIRSLLADGAGGLWIGTMAGVHRLDDGRISANLEDLAVEPVSGLMVETTDHVNTLFQDRQDGIWVGKGSGLYRVRGGELEPSALISGVPVQALYEDHAGTLWVGTNGQGIYRIADGEARRITSQSGLWDDTAFTILEDDAGFLWMSSNRGIYRVAKSELDDLAMGRRARVHSLGLGLHSGMRNVECSSGTPGGWKGHDGRLWFPTLEGVVVVDPTRVEPDPVPPPVVLEALLVDNAGVDPRGVARLGPGIEKLEFRFTAPSFVQPDQIRFRYRLDGYDDQWVSGGTRRVATYTHLPPGRYRFRVTAANGDGVWNESGARMELSLVPYFYQTSWFFWLAVLAGAIVVAGGHKVRVRYLEERGRRLEGVIRERTRELSEAVRDGAVLEERNRIAQELHDSLSQGLAGVVMQLEAARSWMQEEPGAAMERLRDASCSAKECLEETRRSVRALQPVLLDGRDLPLALDRMAAQLSSQGIAVEFVLVGEARPLARSTEIHLLRIVQEAVANALKHAAATLIRVTLGFDGAGIELAVEDDGCGLRDRVNGKAVPGMGLRGMRQRASRLGAELTIASRPERGTVVRLSLADPWAVEGVEMGA